MASRKIEDLTPLMQEKIKEFAARMAETGIPWMITCTFRSPEEQLELWSRGRNGDTRPKVTWTKKSMHTKRTAFDIAILSDGSPTWDLKANVNANDVPDYTEAGQIGESLGLTWGGRWRSPDFAHFELKESEPE
jgi:peptidoglycan L-alanyl-D-glutamate endopeptidase CwlK